MGEEALHDQVSVRIGERTVRRHRLHGQDRVLRRAKGIRRRSLERMRAHQHGLLGDSDRRVGRVVEPDADRRGDRLSIADVGVVDDRGRHKAASCRLPEAHRVRFDARRRSSELQRSDGDESPDQENYDYTSRRKNSHPAPVRSLNRTYEIEFA